jgi:hypothetical protein
MKIKKSDIIKIIETYIFEQEEDEESKSSELVKLDDFVTEANKAIFMLNYDKKTIDVTIEKLEIHAKNIAGIDAAAYLNTALVWAYDSKSIESLLVMCKDMGLLTAGKSIDDISSKLESISKTNDRSKYINNIFKDEIQHDVLKKAQSIINSII